MMQRPTFSIYDASAGSGKTYTLVKEYLKIILTARTNDAYRNILAITFTNKAVHEMKSRIVDSLSDFSRQDPSKKGLQLMQVISDETGLAISEIQVKSRQIIKHIIHNYAGFDISTIDKFTHRVIRAFARDLNLPMTFEVSLDTDNLLQEAVDTLISRAGTDDKLTKLLVDFTMEKTDDDKSWDISREIFETGKMGLNENHRKEILLFSDKNTDAFMALKAKLHELCACLETDCRGYADKALKLISDHGLEFNSFYSGYIPKHFQKISTGELMRHIGHYKYLDEESGKRYAAKTPASQRSAIDKIANDLLNLLKSINENAEKYLLYKAFLKNITPLSLLNSVTSELEKIQSDQNILSISEFNALIHRELQNQPAPFIYERLGEKYRHYFIDEFQDTSEMQWQNLIPLIDNALSGQDDSGAKGTLMIVGDPKQSIYRWRGGKAEQFIELAKDFNPFNNKEKELFTLETNWRSYSQVVEFNNGFFKWVAGEFSKPAYTDLYENHSFQKSTEKKGGYVELQFISPEDCADDGPTKTDLHLKAVMQIIDRLLLQDFKLSDIAILTRKRSQGVCVANFLTENNIPIISSETLLINNASEVRLIINFLHYLHNNSNNLAKAQFLHFIGSNMCAPLEVHDFIMKGMALDGIELEQWLYKPLGVVSISFAELRKKSLYETVEIIVQKFIGNTTNAYVQYFLDIVLERDVRNHAGISDFLNFWEKNGDKFSIPSPEGNDAVRILTIHKAKGLEFPVVIIPFAEEDYSRRPREKLWLDSDDSSIDFPRVLVDNSSAVENFGQVPSEVYQQKKQEELLDNINVLYVAMTRAEEQLYIVSGMNLTSKGEIQENNMSALFLRHLRDIGELSMQNYTYRFGSDAKVSEQRARPDAPIAIESVSEKFDPQNIKIAQRDAVMWGTHQQDSIDYGNLIHEIMEMVSTVSDVDFALQNALDNGLITADQTLAVRKTLIQITTHVDLQEYYAESNKVLTEQVIIRKNGAILKPDRMVIDTNGNILLLDYKTGVHNSKYFNQLEQYSDAIQEIGYNVAKKALVYIASEVNVVDLNS